MNFGKSLCILCDKPLAESTLVAHPCDCPTHHFHCECLVKHARQSRQCPIDRIAFETIICEGGLPITFPKPARPVGNETEVNEVLVKTRPSEERDTSNQDVPERGHSNVTESRSNEETINVYKNTASNFSSLDEATHEAVISEKKDSDTLMCAICGKEIITEEMSSPNCCNHWFHSPCIRSYTTQCEICPFAGCHREIESVTSSTGESYGLRLPESRDYRNMVSAPEDFICKICERADLHRNRAVAKPCGHLLHRSCLIEYVREHKRCPICWEETCTVECDSVGLMFFP